MNYKRNKNKLRSPIIDRNLLKTTRGNDKQFFGDVICLIRI